MANILVLIKNNLKVTILKKPIGFIVSLFAPIIILFIMLKVINFNSGYINIGVIDNDNSKTSSLIINSIKGFDGFNIREINIDEKKKLFSENAINAVIEINNNFEENLINGQVDSIKVTSKSNDSIGDLVKELINNEVNNINKISIAVNKDKDIYYKALENYKDSSYVKIEKQSLSDLYGDYSFSQMFIGFIIMFMLIRGMNTSFRVFKEKEENIYTRIFMAPVKVYEYYLADIISGYISILIQVILGILSIRILNINTGIKDIELFIILALLGLVSISIGVCCRAFSKNINEAANIFNFVNMVMVMIGGAFVPIEMFPKTIEKISYFTPVRWTMESIIKIQQGETIFSIYKYLLIIVLFAIVFLGIGIYKTSKEERYLSIN